MRTLRRAGAYRTERKEWRAAAEGKDWVDAFRERLGDETNTPIEDMSVDWPTPYVTVARLTIPLQNVGDPALASQIEAMTFDTCRHALAAHRPLGNVMRARKVAYIANAKARGARI